ncbi:hypothetical protein [Bacillus toyonensis]|uniref:hypothetical protein n=1 Tax=Bacillus toyonensis TaxID=155322 RepID=UPI00027BEA5F|nr:hypothetical protein [Bacillus toyonensis]EJV41763.1 hypothetical protein IEA_05648 [Bacillus toyonensis]
MENLNAAIDYQAGYVERKDTLTLIINQANNGNTEALETLLAIQEYLQAQQV